MTANAGGSFSFVLALDSTRLGTDLTGRTYTMTARGTDLAGNSTSAIIIVTVPRDQGNGGNW